MKLLNRWMLPVETVSEGNCTEHWTKKAKRHKSHDKWLLFAFSNDKIKLNEDPIKIRWIRVAPRKLDTGDNLPMSFKYARDYLSGLLIPGKARGMADSDPRITWEYDQMTPKEAKEKFQFQYLRGIIVEFYDLSCEQSHT
jgi:hypothetical protein